MREEDEELANVEEMTTGQRLELVLNDLGMSQSDLGRTCGRTPQYVNNIVRRGQRITEGFAQQLCSAVGINLNWLFTGEGAMLVEEASPPAATEEIPTGADVAAVIAHVRHAGEHLLEAADQWEKKKQRDSDEKRSGE